MKKILMLTCYLLPATCYLLPSLTYASEASKKRSYDAIESDSDDEMTESKHYKVNSNDEEMKEHFDPKDIQSEKGYDFIKKIIEKKWKDKKNESFNYLENKKDYSEIINKNKETYSDKFGEEFRGERNKLMKERNEKENELLKQVIISVVNDYKISPDDFFKANEEYDTDKHNFFLKNGEVYGSDNPFYNLKRLFKN